MADGDAGGGNGNRSGDNPRRRRASLAEARRPARVRLDTAARRHARPSHLVVEVVTAGTLRAPGLARWLESVAPARARGAVTVALVPDAEVRLLNRRYRKKDKATDVLSFAAEEPGILGDVVIAADVARRQAAQAGHAFGTELRVLALHGLLHLLGYDHERDDGRMARVERRLRQSGGLREGLIERAPSRAPRGRG